MATNFRSTVTELATHFASALLDAIRTASLDELLAEAGTGRGKASAALGGLVGKVAPAAPRRGPGRPPGSGAGARRKPGRLPRRSADDLEGMVQQIVDLLAEHPGGLRAEQLRSALNVDARELPRPLQQALDKKLVTKQGQKRATTYFAKGAGGRGAGRRGTATAKKAAKGRRGRKKADGGEG
jgi:hypothetical protein